MNPAITVIVPIYNVEEYVGKCLESLHNQTFTNFEVWAVSDGSPDNSKDVVKKWCDIDNRIKFIEKENGGYGSVLQYCIDRIETDYFLVCDPDDWLAPKTLERLYSIAVKNKLDIVVGDKYNVYSDNNQQEYVSSKNSQLAITPNKVYEDSYCVQLFSFLLVSPHAKLYRTKISKGIKFPKHVSYTDFDLYILSLVKAKRALYVPEPLAYYLIDREGNTATDVSSKTVNYYCEVWKAAFDQLGKSSKNIDVLWWRMYAELQLILVQYGKTTKNSSDKKYLFKIYELIRQLQSYKQNIKNVSPSNCKFRIFFNGLMNKYMYKFFCHIYIKIK